MRGFKTRLLAAGVVIVLTTIGTTTASAEVAAGPARPTDKQLRTSDPATTCVRGNARPLVNQADPVLHILVVGPATGGSFTAEFELFTLADGQVIWTGQSYQKNADADGTWFEPQVDVVPLQDATSYGWRARYSDGTSTSPWSKDCELTTDLVKPNSPGVTITPEAPYKVGQTITLHFTNAGSTDVAQYGFGLGEEPTSFVPACPGTAKLTLTSAGPTRIPAWSFDKAGNRSAVPTTTWISVSS